MPHQRDAVAFSDLQPDPFLAMAMRTGKTLAAIRIAHRNAPNGKYLVCAPLTVLIPWMDELAREGRVPRALLAGDAEAFLEAKEPGWYLVGPAALRINSFVLGQDWDYVIVDESTLMRNPKAEITKALNNANVSAKRRICLSGWPCPEGEEDWFEQMRFLGHGRFMGCTNFYQWRNRYFVAVDYDWVPRPGTSLAIKQALIGRVFFLSAAQAGMPDKFVEELRYVKMDQDQEKIYEQVEKDFAATYREHSLSTKWVPVQDLRLHQIASGEVPWDDGQRTRFDGKLRDLSTMLTGELRMEKLVVFFRFDAGVNSVADELASLGIAVARITGETPMDERAAAIHDFQSGKKRVILLQAECGKFALDLSVASVAVFYSQGYSFETYVQCRNRLKHPTKSSPNLLIFLVTKGTCEEHILPALKDKKSVGDFYFTKIYQTIK